MAEKKQTQVMPGMLRNLNKQAQGGGIVIPTSSPTPQQPVQQTTQQVAVAQAPDVQEPDPETLAGWVKKYTGIEGQGIAVWIPKEVKKELDQLRANANETMPLRSLATALIKYAIQQHQDEVRQL